MDAAPLTPQLWIGSRPPRGREIALAGFQALVLCAREYQPAPRAFPGVRVYRRPFRDALDVTERDWKMASLATMDTLHELSKGSRVLVTCWSGWNRSGLVAALALAQHEQIPPPVAGARVRAARGPMALSNARFAGAVGLRTNPWGGPSWYFEGVEDLVEATRGTEPDRTHLPDVLMPADFPHTEGRRVGWAKTTPTVRVPVEKVSFTDLNPWNLGHAAGLAELMRDGVYPILRPPVARIYRIDAEEVRDTQEDYEKDELSYERQMERPWENTDAGTLRADLVDGNHRALAAMAAGEEYIDVAVTDGTRGDVRHDEWRENPSSGDLRIRELERRAATGPEEDTFRLWAAQRQRGEPVVTGSSYLDWLVNTQTDVDLSLDRGNRRWGYTPDPSVLAQRYERDYVQRATQVLKGDPALHDGRTMDEWEVYTIPMAEPVAGIRAPLAGSPARQRGYPVSFRLATPLSGVGWLLALANRTLNRAGFSTWMDVNPVTPRLWILEPTTAMNGIQDRTLWGRYVRWLRFLGGARERKPWEDTGYTGTNPPKGGFVLDGIRLGVVERVKGKTFYWGSMRPAPIGFKVPPFAGVPSRPELAQREQVYEKVRRRDFPHVPPRLGSVFVCPQRTGYCGSPGWIGMPYLYEVKVTGDTFTTDMEGWTAGAFSPEGTAWHYWTGWWGDQEEVDEAAFVGPMLETLVRGDVVVTKELRRPEKPNACPLCEAKRITRRYHECSVCWVADCAVCGVPMVVMRRHTTMPTRAEVEHALGELRRLGPGRVDFERRSIPSHWHAHLRPS